METTLTLRDRLIRAGAERLADVLIEAAAGDKALRRRVEIVAAEHDPEALAIELTSQIEGLRQREEFISYDSSFAFAKELEAITRAIRDRVLPELPERALELADSFLRTDEEVFECVDDSAGSVADEYRDICRLWLNAAAESCREEDWVEQIRATVAEDNYGIREALLLNAGSLLSENQLRRLARQYEEDAARTGSCTATGLPLEARRCWWRVAAVARALHDPALLERAERSRGRPPDDGLLLEVAYLCVEWGQIEEALARLAAVSDTGGYEHVSLLLRCYEHRGVVSKQIELLWQLFESMPDHETYSRLLDLLPEPDKEAARQRARTLALGNRHSVASIKFLLRAGCTDDAERITMEQRDRLDGGSYVALLDVIELAATARCPRIEVVCYRRLLRSILEEKRSKAYGHAARYFQRLAELDQEIDDYGQLCPHQAFVQELRAAHGRKHGFWNRISTCGSVLTERIPATDTR